MLTKRACYGWRNRVCYRWQTRAALLQNTITIALIVSSVFGVSIAGVRPWFAISSATCVKATFIYCSLHHPYLNVTNCPQNECAQPNLQQNLCLPSLPLGKLLGRCNQPWHRTAYTNNPQHLCQQLQNGGHCFLSLYFIHFIPFILE